MPQRKLTNERQSLITAENSYYVNRSETEVWAKCLSPNFQWPNYESQPHISSAPTWTCG